MINVANNIQFLAQTNRFTSQDLNISSGATGIDFTGLYVLFSLSSASNN